MSTKTLKLEAIGDNVADMLIQARKFEQVFARLHTRDWKHFFAPIRRPWVAEVVGYRGGRWYDRVFLDGQKDFSEANGTGSRGVYFYYHLSEGRIYEVRELLSWTRDRRYFCTVAEGELVEMSTDDVQAVLNERAEREAGLV